MTWTPNELPGLQRNRSAVAYLALVGVLALYVALCTGQRDNLASSDAWEHYRAVVALARDPVTPGNPTFATRDPSIRYSPYSVALALIVRSTGWDAYSMLGAAAVFNTLLLFSSLWLFLRRLGATAIAPAFAVVLVGLYGGAPGYAGSFALADLPWHQVNPSAFAVGLALLAFTLFDRLLADAWEGGAWKPGSWLRSVLIVALTSVALLSHGMTGAFTGVGLLAIAWVRSPAPVRATVGVGAACAAAGALGLLWPYYDLAVAVLRRPDNAYWFNEGILRIMLTQWCLPSLLAALCALPLRHIPVVRIGLIGGGLCILAGLAALISESATLARLPLAGVPLLDLAVAALVAETRLLDPRSWPERLRALFGRDRLRSAAVLPEILVALGLVYFGLPQIVSIGQEPHLARSYLAPLLGREDLQRNLKPHYDALLADVGPRDVVLADVSSAWPIPSSNGRIVSALHWEFFTPDQLGRQRDVEAFFSSDSDVDRLALIDRYDVRFILLNPEQIFADVFASLLEPGAIVRERAGWVLMRADIWRAARQP